MIITNEMRAVIVRIQKLKIPSNLISPNLVMSVAVGIGRELTSKQVVYISDNWK